MGDLSKHQCPEPKEREMYYDHSIRIGVVVKLSDGVWECGNDDAGLMAINFCPYCGVQLAGTNVAVSK